MSNFLLQVVEGRAWESSRTFTTGTPAGPLGLGTTGEWVVDGQGVAGVHAYLYFDGNELFAATAQGTSTTLNGAPLTTGWTPVTVPGELQLAGVRVRALAQGAVEEAPAPIEDAATAFFPAKGPGGPAHDDDEDLDQPTRVGPPLGPGSIALPPTVKKPQGGPPPVGMGVPQVPAAGRRPPVGEDATAFLPIEQMRKGLEGAEEPANQGPGPRPAAGAPAVVINPDATAPPGQFGTPDFANTMLTGPPQQPGQPLPPPGMPGGPPLPAKTGLAQAWSNASPPKKAIYVLLPVALLGAAYTTLVDDTPTKTAKAGTSSSAKPPKASPSGSASAGASASAATSAVAPVGSGLLPTGVLLPAAPRPSGSAAPKPPKPGAKVEKSTERQAVDAVIAGDYPGALRLYEQLLKDNPDVAAYQEAVKILRNKTAK